MDNESLINLLNELSQLDIDSYHAYSQVIETIKEEKTLEVLKGFRQDHAVHIEVLNHFVVSLGGVPQSFTRDFKGFLISGYTTIKSMMGELEALKAMRANEEYPLSKYGAAVLFPDLPGHILLALKGHHEDEKRHIATLERLLKEKGL